MNYNVSTGEFSSLIGQLRKRLIETHERLDCYHFLRILYNVLVKLDPQTRNKFFISYYFAINAIVELNNTSLAMLLTFYYKGTVPLSFNYLKSKKGFGTLTEMLDIMKLFLRKGLAYTVQSEDIKLDDVLEILTIDQLKILHGKFCNGKKKTSKSEIIKDIINAGKQRNLMCKSVGTDIKNQVIEMLSGLYKFNPKIHKLITGIIALHYPDLIDLRNNNSNEQESIVGKTVLQKLSRSTDTDKIFRNNSDIIIIKIYNDLEDVLEYVDALEMLRRIQLIDDIQSTTFIGIIKYTKEAFVNDSRKIFNLLNRNLPIGTLQYTRVSVLCYIFFVAAEKFSKAKEYKVAENLYYYITEDINLIPFIGSKKYSEYWIRRCINIKNNGDLNFQKEFYENISNYSGYILESTNIEIFERKSKLMGDTKNCVYKCESEEIVLPILKKTGDCSIKNQFFYHKNNTIHLVNVENAVLEYFMSTNKFTHGGHYENNIWIETLYLIFGDLIFKKFNLDMPYCHEFTIEHPLLGSKDFVRRNIMFLGDRYNTFVFGKKKDQSKIIRENMELYWKNKNINEDSAIFINCNDFIQFINCVNIQNLLLLCIHQMSFKKNLFSGYPDLVLWNVKTKDIVCYEVKGPGDTLTGKQKLASKILNTFLHIPCKCINVKGQPQNPSVSNNI
uniref:Fanconi-associated nuclease n=1 Tax=Strongyloides venezuelensis TaxID=75913 RepID=A0A0K0FXQ4_STRVS